MCELCGNKPVSFKMVVEGSELLVCRDCKSPEAVEFQAPRPPDVTPRPATAGQELIDILPDYGERIKAGRKERGIGRGDLAVKLGIKESLLSKIEASQLEPDQALMTRLEKTLGIKLTGRIEYKMSGYVPHKPTTLGDIVELK